MHCTSLRAQQLAAIGMKNCSSSNVVVGEDALTKGTCSSCSMTAFGQCECAEKQAEYLFGWWQVSRVDLPFRTNCLIQPTRNTVDIMLFSQVSVCTAVSSQKSCCRSHTLVVMVPDVAVGAEAGFGGCLWC